MSTTSASEPAVDVSKMSFQEFHAVRNRKRTTVQEEYQQHRQFEKGTSNFIPVQKQDDGDDKANITSNRRAICGKYIEYPQTQMLVMGLIILDILFVTIELFGGVPDAASSSFPTTSVIAMQFIESFTGFTIIAFLFELGIALYAFQLRFFTHFGYLSDLVVLLSALYYQIMHQSKAWRLLGIFRFWRAVRIVNSLLDAEQAKHDETKRRLEHQRLATEQLQNEKRVLEKSLENELEARNRIELTLGGYKDEIETLKEALNIAALSIAEASAGGGYLSDDDDFGDGVYDDEPVAAVHEQEEDVFQDATPE